MVQRWYNVSISPASEGLTDYCSTRPVETRPESEAGQTNLVTAASAEKHRAVLAARHTAGWVVAYMDHALLEQHRGLQVVHLQQLPDLPAVAGPRFHRPSCRERPCTQARLPRCDLAQLCSARMPERRKTFASG